MLYQDVPSIDGCSCLEFRASCVFFFAGGGFALVFGLVAAFRCGFLARCHGAEAAEGCSELCLTSG